MGVQWEALPLPIILQKWKLSPKGMLWLVQSPKASWWLIQARPPVCDSLLLVWLLLSAPFSCSPPCCPSTPDLEPSPFSKISTLVLPTFAHSQSKQRPQSCLLDSTPALPIYPLAWSHRTFPKTKSGLATVLLKALDRSRSPGGWILSKMSGPLWPSPHLPQQGHSQWISCAHLTCQPLSSPNSKLLQTVNISWCAWHLECRNCSANFDRPGGLGTSSPGWLLEAGGALVSEPEDMLLTVTPVRPSTP